MSGPIMSRQVLEWAVDLAYRAGQVAAERFFAVNFSTSTKADGTEITDVAGFPQGYEDLAPLPVLLAEAGGVVTDLSGGPVLSGPGTALISTGQLHAELLNLVADIPHNQRQS
jgi:3'-phosphoadenosine 5'-phosphosulfate (PAPS) 3'-phosphatase